MLAAASRGRVTPEIIVPGDNPSMPFWSLTYDTTDYINAYMKSKEPVTTTIPELDGVLSGGFRPGLYVLGGMSGAGKTALGIYMAVRIASRPAPDGKKYGAVFYSMELGGAEVRARAGSLLSSLVKPLEPFRWAEFEERGANARLLDKRGEYVEGEDPVYLADLKLLEMCPRLRIVDATRGGYPDASLEAVIDYIRDTGAHGGSIVFIDYLQCIEVRDKADRPLDEQEAMRVAARQLNQAAMRAGVAVVAIAAVNRASSDAARRNERPTMGMFRGSSWIEYTGIACMGLVRSESADADGAQDVHLYVVKNRRGLESDIPLVYWGSFGLFDWQEPRP